MQQKGHPEEQTMRHSERSEESKIVEIDSSVTAFPQNDGVNKCAFTLAEVLIIIAIIGVVAAMTIPSLITKYQKNRVAVQLKSFYSKINNTLRLMNEEYGELDGVIAQYNPNRESSTYESNKEFLQKYFSPFIKISHYKPLRSAERYACAVLLDGGALCIRLNTTHAMEVVYVINPSKDEIEVSPKNYFNFRYSKNSTSSGEQVTDMDYIRPYDWSWDGTREGLRNSTTQPAMSCKKGCTKCNYCAKYIQINGWKLPDDYPW